MKKRYKFAGVFLIFLTVAIGSLGLVLSYDSACGPAKEIGSDTERMQAIVYRCYGSADVLQLEDVAKPAIENDEVLVRVQAASVNPLDWHYMRGEPYFMRMSSGIGAPADTRIGVDFAGTVEAVGNDVRRFKVGDEVFGGKTGAFAEYVALREDGAIARKPASMTFEQAATVPIAGITALQALRDLGQVKAGQKVLINGASGGVGTFAVQIAKSFGAEVTGVCSTRNVEMVLSIGADHVVDYTQEDFTESGKQYDVIVDNVGNHALSKYTDVLNPDGRFVIVGAQKGNWIGPLVNPLTALVLSPFVDQEFAMFIAELNQEDLTILGNLMQAGKVTPVVDSRYRLHDVPDAIRHSEDGHARGKIVIAVE